MLTHEQFSAINLMSIKLSTIYETNKLYESLSYDKLKTKVTT